MNYISQFTATKEANFSGSFYVNRILDIPQGVTGTIIGRLFVCTFGYRIVVVILARLLALSCYVNLLFCAYFSHHDYPLVAGALYAMYCPTYARSASEQGKAGSSASAFVL